MIVNVKQMLETNKDGIAYYIVKGRNSCNPFL